MSEQEKHATCRDGKPWPCKKCSEPTVWYTSDETYDGAYDRYHYRCRSCGLQWSVVDEVD